MTLRFVAPVATLAALVLITGCATTPAPTPLETETYVSDPAPEEPAALTPNPVEPDALLMIRAIATTENGASLSLEMQVHQSVRWDDVPNQTLPAALAEDCGGTLTPELFAAGSWSFTRATLTAIPVGDATWPETEQIGVLPSAATVYISGRGVLAHDDASGAALCTQSKYLSAAGRGGVAFGIPGDTPAFVRWAGHRFELVALTEGVTLSECSVELTALGSSLLGEAEWAPSGSATACGTGPAVETVEY